MEPQITVTVTAATHEELSLRLIALGEKLSPNCANEVKPTEETPPKAKRGRPAKTVDVESTLTEEVTTEEETTEDEVDLGDETEVDQEITLAMVIEACKKQREKAVKVLAKYKVKSVRDLKKEQYADVLKSLK